MNNNLANTLPENRYLFECEYLNNYNIERRLVVNGVLFIMSKWRSTIAVVSTGRR